MDKTLEEQIREQIARVCNFEIREKDYKCNQCGKRFTKKFGSTEHGTNVNERMLEHYNAHLARKV